MKKITPLLLVTILVTCLQSCNTTFYQVYEAESTGKSELKQEDKTLVFEDKNAIIYYDLWNESGDIGFTFHNKTDEIIEVDLGNSYFISNSVAHDYFKDRVTTNSFKSRTSIGNGVSQSSAYSGYNFWGLFGSTITATHKTSSSSGNSIAKKEKEIIKVPPQTSKKIAEYNLNDDIYRDCDLYLYPSKRKIKTKQFSAEESPLVFSNLISYAVNQADPVEVENEFYISKITNYPEKEMKELVADEFCEEKSIRKVEKIKKVQPNRFYLKYEKRGVEKSKH